MAEVRTQATINNTITTVVETNGYELNEKIVERIRAFEKSAMVFKDATIYHFYYGEDCDMVTLKLTSSYAHYTITRTGVSLTGYTCDKKEYESFKNMEQGN